MLDRCGFGGRNRQPIVETLQESSAPKLSLQTSRSEPRASEKEIQQTVIPAHLLGAQKPACFHSPLHCGWSTVIWRLQRFCSQPSSRFAFSRRSRWRGPASGSSEGTLGWPPGRLPPKAKKHRASFAVGRRQAIRNPRRPRPSQYHRTGPASLLSWPDVATARLEDRRSLPPPTATWTPRPAPAIPDN